MKSLFDCSILPFNAKKVKLEKLIARGWKLANRGIKEYEVLKKGDARLIYNHRYDKVEAYYRIS